MDLLGPLRSSPNLAVKRSEAAHFAHSHRPLIRVLRALHQESSRVGGTTSAEAQSVAEGPRSRERGNRTRVWRRRRSQADADGGTACLACIARTGATARRGGRRIASRYKLVHTCTSRDQQDTALFLAGQSPDHLPVPAGFTTRDLRNQWDQGRLSGVLRVSSFPGVEGCPSGASRVQTFRVPGRRHAGPA